MNYKIYYNNIRKVMSYDLCRKNVLPYLGKTFTTEEFRLQFLLAFNESEKHWINGIGFPKLTWWLENYYINKVATEYKDIWPIKPKSKRKLKKWTADQNYKEFRIVFDNRLIKTI